jgi:hypothetical protein
VSESYSEKVAASLKRFTGKTGDIARALADYNTANYYQREEFYNKLKSLIIGSGGVGSSSSSSRSLDEIFDYGPRKIFTKIAGKDFADKAGKVAHRMHDYVYSPSIYRRSFRTKDAAPYFLKFVNLLETVFFDWSDWDFAKDIDGTYAAERLAREELIKESKDADNIPPQRPTPPTLIQSDFIALEIDEGNEAVISAIKEVILGDNNTTLLNHTIIRAILKSSNTELYKLLTDLLLAARLQEGLRQSLLEEADTGRVEGFIALLSAVLDNDLLRYSSAQRAVLVWTGMGYEAAHDRRQTEKLANLCYSYLIDEAARRSGIESDDALEIYASLWATSVFELNDITPLINTLSQGEKYKKLVALYFSRQVENVIYQTKVAATMLGEEDMDVLAYALASLKFGGVGRYGDPAQFFERAGQDEYLAELSAAERLSLFDRLAEIAPLIPEKGLTVTEKPFEWCSLTFTRQEMFILLIGIAAFKHEPEYVTRLLDLMKWSEPTARHTFIKYFLYNPSNGRERDYLFESLSDKSMSVRKQALTNIKELSLTPDESDAVLNLLSLKTGDLRQNAVEILMGLPEDGPFGAARTLIADKNTNKRLGGLDMLLRLKKSKTVTEADVSDAVSLLTKVTAQEKLLIDEIIGKPGAESGGGYNFDNGYGLFDPEYVPVFDFSDAPSKSVSPFVFDSRRIIDIFSKFCALIEENKDYTYQVEIWDGSMTDVVLGAQRYSQWLLKPKTDDAGAAGGDASVLRADIGERRKRIDDYVLSDVWRGWITDNKVIYRELFTVMFLVNMGRYSMQYKPEHTDRANKLIEKCFNAAECDKVLSALAPLKHRQLATNIIPFLWDVHPEAERFEVAYGVMTHLLEEVPHEMWGEKANKKKEGTGHFYYGNTRPTLFADLSEFGFVMGCLRDASEAPEHFVRFLSAAFSLGAHMGVMHKYLSLPDLAHGVSKGILKDDVLYRAFLDYDDKIEDHNAGGRDHYLAQYTARVINNISIRNVAEAYPFLRDIAARTAARVIELELARGDTRTDLSDMATMINRHEGAQNFAGILTALGKETFLRGYLWTSVYTKKEVLSSLLKASVPSAEDNAKTLKLALDGRIGERRLLEAAMYSPAWLKTVAGLLGWEGLESAAWYFHAHTNENLSAEKETEIARWSRVTPQEFNDGAFDVDWFWDAHNTLGAERFGELYACAKYISSGSTHRRAQLYADAALGKLKVKALEKEIKDKRNKDKLLAYPVIPFDKKDADGDMLRRYAFIQQFLKESKKFGAQRHASEGKACAVALDNLARNAGFSDALRFSWRMETLKIQEIQALFAPKAIGAYEAFIEVDEEGGASVVILRSEKQLKSVPAELKKDPYVIELKETVKGLKEQYRRARASLEQAMVNGDVFEYGELAALMQHPVISPLLSKLLFVEDSGARLGAFCELAELDAGALVRIAHPYDLYKSGKWHEQQRYAFEHRLVQPFKQIFRELYLTNEDELREGKQSRRYAGHQVQPKKTVALLKGRGWTVDYEEGLQRVYYKENIIATIYAAADWFAPSDIEAPTLEVVRFYDRKTREILDLADIPPVLFSEVMRDIDLVVSVAHIGGVDPEASFSTIEMRAVIVSELLALLKIENARVDGRLVRIDGSLGEYTLHLGSGLVQMIGKGSINILAVPSQHRGRIFLPFADDDPRTAEIMSKTLLLAEDKKIKDPAILAQIG